MVLKFRSNIKFLLLFILLIIYSIFLIYASFRLSNYFTYNNTQDLNDLISIRFLKNYFNGLGATPKTSLHFILTDKNLNKLMKDRDIAMKKGILSSEHRTTVPAKIIYNEDSVNVKIRLKGDLADHWKNAEKLSFRVSIIDTGKLILKMSQFSIQHPATKNYVYEWLFHKFVKQEGIIGINYDNINVYINGKNHGIFAIEEYLSEELLKNNNRKNSFFVKFSDNMNWQNDQYGFYESNLSIYNEKKINNEILNIGITKIESFRRGNLLVKEVFDLDKLSKYHAICTIFGATHGIYWTNCKFYFNPSLKLFEPISYDGNAGKMENGLFFLYDFWQEDYLTKMITNDTAYIKKYIQNLYIYSDSSLLNKFLKENDTDLNLKIKEIHNEFPYFHFNKDVFYHNIMIIDKIINPTKNLLNAYYIKDKGKYKVLVGSLYLPIELNELYNNNINIYRFSKNIIKNHNKANKVNYTLFDIPEQLFDEKEKTKLSLTYHILGSSVICTTNVKKYDYDISTLLN